MALVMARNLNVRRLKMVIWVLTLVVGAGATLDLLELIKDHGQGKYENARMGDFDKIIAEGGERSDVEILPPPRVDQFQTLWKSPINGYVAPKPPKEVPKPEQPAVPALKPIKDVITVGSIIFSPGEGPSFAYISYNDTSDSPAVSLSEKVLRPGSPLKYPFDSEPYLGKVLDIQEDGVEFSWGGENITLRPPRYTDDPEASKKPKKTASNEPRKVELNQRERDIVERHKRAPNTMVLSELGPNSYLVGARDRNRFSGSTEDVLREVRVGEQDGRNGKEVVLRTVTPHYQRSYGVQNGDMIISINGVPVTSKAKALNYLRQNPDLPKYEVVLRRRGKEERRTFYVPRSGE